MAEYLKTEQEVLDAIGVENFRNVPKKKIVEFVSQIPNMDREVAMKIIGQFPSFVDSAKHMIGKLSDMTAKALKSNNESQKQVAMANQKIIDELSAALKRNNLSIDETLQITDKMITVANNMASNDAANKHLIKDLFTRGAAIIGGAIVVAATILGVNVKTKK